MLATVLWYGATSGGDRTLRDGLSLGRNPSDSLRSSPFFLRPPEPRSEPVCFGRYPLKEDEPEDQDPDARAGARKPISFRKLADFANLLGVPGRKGLTDRRAKSAAEIEPEIAYLNEKHAIVSETGRATIITERHDHDMGRMVLDRSTAADFKLMYQNQIVFRNDKPVKLGDHWLNHADRRQYEGIVFNPDPHRDDDPNLYNLWRGFAVAAQSGSWVGFKKHMFEIGAAGDEGIFDFILDWLAWWVQYPHKQGETAIVWRGNQGAGKGFIARTLGKLVGQHFVHITSSRHLVGNFNDHLRDASLVFADEAFWAGDKQGEGVLKTLITEPTIMIEGKYRNPIVVANRTHVTMATNNDWAAPVGMGDRRFCVVDVPDTHIGDRKYFAGLEKEMVEGGLAAMFYDLLRRPIERAPVIPRSVAALESSLTQKLFSMSETHRWWFEKLEKGNLWNDGGGWRDGEIEKSALHTDYIAYTDRLKISRRSSETILGIMLKELVPKLASIRPRVASGSRPHAWRFPPLSECRQAFAASIRMPDSIFSNISDDDEG